MTRTPTSDFPVLIRKFAKLIDFASRIPMTNERAWKNSGQLLLIKAFRHLESIGTLFNGIETELNGKKLPVYIDHSSISVLARAAYETYVIFYFIFCDGTAAEQQLRYQVWRMNGLMSRQKLHGPLTGEAGFGAQKVAERFEIDRLRALITDHPSFRSLKAHVRDNVKKGTDVRLGEPLLDLAERAGLPRKYAADMYNHLCNYTHSGAISTFQIHDATAEQNADARLAGATVSFCTILLVELVFAYTTFFEEVDEYAVGDDELWEIADEWALLKMELAKLYDALPDGCGGA
jgi:hypothetical protein